MLNRVVLIGRLTRDPELRFTQSGIAVCTFTLAVDRNFKSANGERETDFIDIVVWRQQGENCANYLSKGKLAAVDGQLRVRSYETQDGQKRKAYEVVADNVRFLSPKEGGSAPSGAAYGASTASEPSPFGAGDMVDDDDLPF
ncbi:MAG: single-stranded DNA-binding protein [Firmicutes bacterium]|nr:single-stranded DNA-binding protein [Bacillota bacterium]